MSCGFSWFSGRDDPAERETRVTWRLMIVSAASSYGLNQVPGIRIPGINVPVIKMQVLDSWCGQRPTGRSWSLSVKSPF